MPEEVPKRVRVAYKFIYWKVHAHEAFDVDQTSPDAFVNRRWFFRGGRGQLPGS